MSSILTGIGKVVAELAQRGVIIEDERRFGVFLRRCLDNVMRYGVNVAP